MKKIFSLVAVIALSVAVGCDDKKPGTGSGSAKGTGSTTPAGGPSASGTGSK